MSVIQKFKCDHCTSESWAFEGQWRLVVVKEDILIERPTSNGTGTAIVERADLHFCSVACASNFFTQAIQDVWNEKKG